MASGTPGICVDAGGLKDFTVHGGNAFVCAPRKADALTEAMEAMMDERLRERIRAGALRTAGERSWETIFSGLLQAYPLALPLSRAV
jgi:glycosyltransferase involved in cell wall biosynthesis